MASEHHSLPQAYIDAYSGQKLVTFCICFIVLLTVCILLRFWARRVKGGIALDDYLSIPSYILCVGLCGLGIGLVQHAGVGRHAAALAVVNPTALITMGKSIIGIAYLYLPAVALPKLSILALYWRFLDRSPAYRRTIQALAGIIILNLVTCLIVFSVECQPFAYHWNKKIPGGHCVNEAAMFAYVSLPNIITDVVMLLLPMRVVYKLKANGSTKAGLLVVFVTGNIGLAASIVRFVMYLHQSLFLDITWNSVDSTIWTVMEPGVYLVASCLLTYRPLLTRIFQRDFEKLSSGPSVALTPV